jgi:(S)-3,5-dihydroxyphenylglycine transaminase
MDPVAADLSLADLHPALDDPSLTSMNFLNEIAGRFPDALSLAAGRPFGGFYETEALHRYLRIYRDYLRDERGFDDDRIAMTLHQYGRTKGIVSELLARNLSLDEDITVDPESIVVTVGCQEAMFLVLRALRADDRDVLLAVSPMYVGITGAAKLVDMPVLGVADGPDGVDLVDLAAKVAAARADGLRPRALYVVPDFANPSGVTVPVAVRRALLDFAAQEGLLILEDNPYGLFPVGDQRLPTLKSLDRDRVVVYLGSLAKTVFPGVRIGYAVADQRVVDPVSGRIGLFADELSKIKSMVTVNTAPVAQAIAAGKLLEHGCSLVPATVREREVYQANLTRMLAGLARSFPPGSPVTWNVPAGGFFVVVTVPFLVDDELLAYSAREHQVLWTPMHHFYAGAGDIRQLRLSYSYLPPDDLDEGIRRFASFVSARLQFRGAPSMA